MGDSKTEQPERFGHYRVMTDGNGRPVKLGEGAMGVTYLAEDTNLRVKVALKVIAPSLLGDAEIVHRFQREAQAAARLRHPNVAAVYHLGTVDDTFFYTMEFVEGRTLREHIAANGPLDIKQSLDVTLQICEALGAAERHQMVHRDIKPANIMLESTEDGLHAKLIDFGLAKPLQQDAQQTSALLTQRGTFLGTAVFASPEQVQDLPLDTRSDFYALGLTLWYMLEGRPPFEGSLHKVLYDQVHTKAPFDRLLWVPAEVRGLLDRLLEKQPPARPQTARELRQMIHDCLRAVAATNTSQADWQRRFQVHQAARPQPWGSIYEGQDTLSGAVWLHFLRSDRFHDADSLNRVIAEVRRAIEIHHPNVLRHVTVFPTNDGGDAGWMVVTEHPGAHTLLGHLQKVKQLSTAEAFPLIERLGEALDCCLASDLPAVDLDPARVFLKPQSAVTSDAPVEVVPKLCPIDYSALSSLRQSDDTALGLTQILPSNEIRTARDAVQRLASLTYHCLGGAWGRLHRYIPLPGLTQRQNETLREAITEKKFARAAEFLEALQQAKAPRRPAPAPVSEAEATVTLSPWERLAALASPGMGTASSAAPSVAVGADTPTRSWTPPESVVESLAAPQAAEEARASEPVPEQSVAAFTEVPEPIQEDAGAPPDQQGQEPLPEDEPEESQETSDAEVPAPESTLTTPPEVKAPQEEQAFIEPLPEVQAPPVAPEPSVPPAPAATEVSAPPVNTSSVRTRATELPLAGHGHSQATQSAKTRPINALRETVEREWRDAKPIIDKVATPVRETVTTLPRWVFITLGCFIVVVGVALWAIATRPVGGGPKLVTVPGKAIVSPSEGPGKVIITPVPPPPPPGPPSLDQLLQTGTEAATRGDAAALLPIWQDMQRRFPEPKWAALAKSPEFISAVTTAWQENKLGDPAKAAHDYLPIIAIAARGNDTTILSKLSTDLQEDPASAERFELALLDALSEDSAKLEMLLDESLRLVKTRKTGKVSTRARDLIRQMLDPLVGLRERKPRPDDVNVQLQNALDALQPKLKDLSVTEEPSALYLYAYQLRTENRKQESLALFERAAQLGHAPSMVQAGMLMSNDKSSPSSVYGAVNWFKMADAKGYAKATFLLGECYLDGTGVSRDYDLALELLNKAASEDIREAHFILGGTYLGLGRPSEAGSAEAFDPARLNPSLQGEERLVKARSHLEKAWRRGEMAAAQPLARLFITGQGGPVDIKQGVEILDSAASQPSPDPGDLRILAYFLMDENFENLPTTKERKAAGVKPDAKRAQQLMLQAAKLGDVAARHWCEEKGVKY